MINPFATEPDNPSSSSTSSSIPVSQPHQQQQPPPMAAPAPAPAPAEQWGTYVMGAPAAPSSHPDNQKAAAFWGASSSTTTTNTNPPGSQQQHPYLVYSPAAKPADSPMESILHVFNSWANKAETLGNNIWHNLKTSSSVSGAAWGKMNLTAKAISEGGFESLYKQTFSSHPNEKLRKRFACYLSTATGPVAGTLYLTNLHAAFCSDRPLSFAAPSGQETWSYYKVAVPLNRVGGVNPVVMTKEKNAAVAEKYIQVVTVDGHEFWFMGFVNFEKAVKYLSEGISGFVAPGVAAV